MCQPHKHAAVIKAWADGETIECRTTDRERWTAVHNHSNGAGPLFYNAYAYRVKPKPLTLDEVYLAARAAMEGVPVGMSSTHAVAWRNDFMKHLIQLLKENNHV